MEDSMTNHMPGELTVSCSRCGRDEATVYAGNSTLVPEGWEGSIGAAVCPGCQLALWHPLCETIVDTDTGRPIDIDAMQRAIRNPETWTCPRCGGTDFVLVHADYPLSGLRGSSFKVSLEEERPLDEDA
jgi:hypothetical protein